MPISSYVMILLKERSDNMRTYATRGQKEILNTTDFIAQELLTIEESAKMVIGCTTIGDQCLEELNLPRVSDLIYV
jgi:hypothetical protein